MAPVLAADLHLSFSLLTPERWDDLEKLFGPRGAFGGCWCMWWRVKRSEFEKMQGEGNRQAMKSIIESGEVPGILAYAGDQPVGWCSIAPRHHFPALERSRTLKAVDDLDVWSVVCFFVAKGYRRHGITVSLLQAAIDYAKEHGAQIVEGYPVETGEGGSPDPFVYTGLVSAYTKVGFEEVLRRSPKRPIMRYYIK
ncbi:MAG: GNAT family N-acetyltransferase [Chloroflexi bacterium RBG_16_52_11]|nr:MAG: GNAT family N-acetyltransferase [Chloroflexi bacterium RBG_16_52_11]